MENVPNIVKERLKPTAIAVDHPDADLLTAFSERALADRERSQVVEHLARCVECREVVALALPAEEANLAVVRPVRGNWLTWPRLRWGLVAAGVIVVGSFGALRYERSGDLKPVAIQSSRADGMATDLGNQAKSLAASRDTPAQSLPSVPAAKSFDVAAKPQIAEAKKKSDAISLVAKSQAPRDDKAAIGNRLAILHGQALPHGPMPPAQWQQNLNANAANQQMMAQSQAPAAPASDADGAAMTVSAQSLPTATPSTGGPIPSEKQIQTVDALPINGRNVAALTPLSKNNAGEVARAKDAQPPASNAPKATGAYDISETPTSNFSPTGSLVAESAHWAINSAGGLQRSFDQGKTWQPVEVNSGERDASGVNLQLAMKSSHAKTAAKDKAEAKPRPIIFRAVAANGPDVWAGASEANLFHSTDSGDHWLRIQPSWRGIELTGDILSLQFADPQHGRIVTSTAEIWTTADAGQTWDKQ